MSAPVPQFERIMIVQTPPFNPVDGGVQRISWKLGRFFGRSGVDVSYYSTASDGHVEPENGTLFHFGQVSNGKSEGCMHHLTSVLHSIQPQVILNQMPYEEPLAKELRVFAQQSGALLIGCLNNSLFATKNNLSNYCRQSLPGSIARFSDNRAGHAILFVRHWLRHRAQLRAIIDQHDLFVLPTDCPSSVMELEYFVGSYKKNKIAAVPNSIELPPATRPEQKQTVTLHVGRINDGQKRSDLLAEIWAGVESVAPDWTFDVLGDGPYMDQLKRDIDRRNLQRLTLWGFQSPDAWYEKSQIFIMPSAFEGFPSVLLEAQAYGLVPVAFDSYPAVSEILHHDEDALLVPAFDCAAMAKAIVSLVKDDEKRAKMSQAARRNAEKYSLDRVGATWISLINQRLADQQSTAA